MICDIILNFSNGESISLVQGMDSSLIPSEINEDFMKLVQNEGITDQLKNAIEQSLLYGLTEDQIQGESKQEYLDQKYHIANATAKDIAKSYPDIPFPETVDLSKIKVRLAYKFEKYGTNIIVRKTADGEDIYVLDGEISTLKKFARHLKLVDAINNQVLSKLDPKSKESKILDKILSEIKSQNKFKKAKIDSKEKLLQHHMRNKNLYSKFYIDYDGKTVTALMLLNKIIPKIEGIYYPRNNSFSNPLVSLIYSFTKFNNGIPNISYVDLFSALKNSIGGVEKLFKSAEEFNKIMKTSDRNEQLVKFFESLGVQEFPEDALNYELLFKAIFSKERGFPYIFGSIDRDGTIKFKNTYYTLSNTYGMTYDTILLMNETRYKGWRIYEDDNNQFFISRYEAQPSTAGKPFTSMAKAKAEIDTRIQNQTFKDSFFLKIFENYNNKNNTFKVNLSQDCGLKKGNIIRIPVISLPENIVFNDSRESMVKGKSTISSFKELVKQWSPETQEVLLQNEELIPYLQDVTRIGLFLEILNWKYPNEARTPEVVNAVLNTIKSSPVEYLYVEEVNYNKYSKEKEVKLRKLGSSNPELSVDMDYKRNKGFQYPLISFWTEISETLNRIFGTKFEALTQEEVRDKFGNEYANHKAFIIGDNVYLNTTLGSTEDLFHEYIHIIMGYLKVNNREAYGKLLKDVWNSSTAENRRDINRIYRNYDYESKLEENFVKRFAEYIYNQGNFKDIFEGEAITDSFSTIFDKSTVDLKEAGKRPVTEILSRFSTEIQMALQNDNKLFKSTASSDEFRLNNRKTNLLHRWIEEGKLKEYNCQ